MRKLQGGRLNGSNRMALNRPRLESSAGQQSGVRIDSMVLGLMQQTETLEHTVGQLFELLRDPIYLYLVAALGSPVEAEDVTQESFLQLYLSLHRGQVISNVRFWL